MNCPALKAFFVLFFAPADLPDDFFVVAISGKPLIHAQYIRSTFLNKQTAQVFRSAPHIVFLYYHKSDIKSSHVTIFLEHFRCFSKLIACARVFTKVFFKFTSFGLKLFSVSRRVFFNGNNWPKLSIFRVNL